MTTTREPHLADNAITRLAADIASVGATSFTIADAASIKIDDTVTDCYMKITSLSTYGQNPLVSPPTSELAKVTSVAGEVLGCDALTQTWVEGDVVEICNTSEVLTYMNNKINALENLLSYALGTLDTAVASSYPDDDLLQVVEQDIPDMTVKVNAGVCMIGRSASRLELDTTSVVIVAPSTSDRHDLVTLRGSDDTVQIKTGVEGGLIPSVPAGHIELASILLTTSHTTIETGDISDARKTT